MYKIYKILLLLPLAIVELLLLVTCWILAIPFPTAAGRICQWAEDNLPNREWYYS